MFAKALKITSNYSIIVLQHTQNGDDEIIANLFRISQTEQKLRKDNVKTEKEANETH